MNQFTEKYKQLTITELLKILENPNDYQPLAVEAAKAELDSRNLSDSDLNLAKQEFAQQKQMIEQDKQKNQERVDSANDIFKKVLDSFNPFKKDSKRTDRFINLLSLLFVLIISFSIYRNCDLIINAIKGIVDILYCFINFFPIIWLIVATYLFWKRKKAGWILLTIYFVLTLFSTLFSFVSFFLINIYYLYLVPMNSPIVYLLAIVFQSLLLCGINRKDVRGKLQIKKNIIIGTYFGILAVYLMFILGANGII